MEKGGKPDNAGPIAGQAPPMKTGQQVSDAARLGSEVAHPALSPVKPAGPATFDRRSYQREYMRKYREAGRDRSRKGYKPQEAE